MNVEAEFWKVLWWVLWLLSLVHVFSEARRMREPAARITLMVAICFWPLGYLFWVFYWPATLRRKLQGKDRLKPVLPVGKDAFETSKVQS